MPLRDAIMNIFTESLLLALIRIDSHFKQRLVPCLASDLVSDLKSVDVYFRGHICLTLSARFGNGWRSSLFDRDGVSYL